MSECNASRDQLEKELAEVVKYLQHRSETDKLSAFSLLQ